VRRKRTVADLETIRANALARARRYDARSKSKPAYASQYRFIAKQSRQLADELQQRIDVMRRSNIDEPVTTNDEQYPWRAQRQLRFGDRVYRRGEVVPDDIVNASLNVVHLINGGHIRRMPAPVSTPIPAAIMKLAANPHTVTPRDCWSECRTALKSVAAERKCSLREAANLRDNLDAVERAIKSRMGSSAHRPVDKLYDELFTEEA
jgi:hypothetical protein